MKRFKFALTISSNLLLFGFGCTGVVPPTTNGPAPEKTVQSEWNEPTVAVKFTFASEAKYDTTFSAFIDDKQVYAEKLLTYVNHGYGGEEFDYRTIEVPNRTFTLTVKESASGKEETKQIDPADGLNIAATFWGDRYEIVQSKEKLMRVD